LTLIDISRIEGEDHISLDDKGWIHLGPLVTHNQVVSSSLLVEKAFPLAQACWEVGAPQIRNRGTLAGNLITASPANDTITPLMALGARVTLKSLSGERVVDLNDFYKGVRKTDIRPDEMLVDIGFPALDPKTQKGGFLKLGLREAQAISVVNVAVVLSLEKDQVKEAAIILGSVAPTVIHARAAEKYLAGKTMDDEYIKEASHLAMEDSKPIDDIRGSANYRRQMVEVLTGRLLQTLVEGNIQEKYPSKPILLTRKDAKRTVLPEMTRFNNGKEIPIQTMINGKEYQVQGAAGKSLLRMLREDLLLMGSKEGCAEGECGACTVLLDGKAVMSCLVPAPRAHRAVIETIEGIGDVDHLHPMQQSFVDHGAVQCGYCTPGFIMSAVTLVEEKPHPAEDEIKRAVAGNLCRCTGYRKIIEAIELVERP
ncbi:MAG: FAD binding domain-containing protein, partial [Chloroflexi bacterium]|nr:FAD binding domain-containing protein [Chloroflexota bacterium]